jgi:hypothetical protein
MIGVQHPLTQLLLWHWSSRERDETRQAHGSILSIAGRRTGIQTSIHNE